jgi:hypothetical protein
MTTAHLLVNVAEDKRDAWFIELDEARAATLIQSEIEALALKE